MTDFANVRNPEEATITLKFGSVMKMRELPYPGVEPR
jgi:hypothetical protein